MHSEYTNDFRFFDYIETSNRQNNINLQINVCFKTPSMKLNDSIAFLVIEFFENSFKKIEFYLEKHISKLNIFSKKFCLNKTPNISHNKYIQRKCFVSSYHELHNFFLNFLFLSFIYILYNYMLHNI